LKDDNADKGTDAASSLLYFRSLAVKTTACPDTLHLNH